MAYKHGLANTRTYKIWIHIIDRLTNPKHIHYNRYGGRGISILKEWEDFEKFYQYFGNIPKGYELDRINNNGNYEPSNLRVTTRKINGQNTISCKYWVIDGIEYQSKRDAAKELGVAPSTIRGWCTGLGGVKQRDNCYCELKYKEETI